MLIFHPVNLPQPGNGETRSSSSDLSNHWMTADIRLVSICLSRVPRPAILDGMVTVESRLWVINIWSSSTSGLKILSQQRNLKFGEMGQGRRYIPQESPDRISHVAYIIILSSCLTFSDDLRLLVFSNWSYSGPHRVFRHAEITIR